MKIRITHRTVQAQGEGRINPGTIPPYGKLVMLAMLKRDGLPSPRFFVPVVSMGCKDEKGYFKFATENDIRNARAHEFMPGEVWWELPRNPLWTEEQRIEPDSDVRAMLDKTAAEEMEGGDDTGADSGADAAGTADEGTDR